MRQVVKQKPDLLNVRNALATVLHELGDLDGAELLFRQSLDYYREIGFLIAVGSVSNGLGDLEYARGNLDRALQIFEEGRCAYQEAGVTTDWLLRGIGRIAYVQGDSIRAERLLAACIADTEIWHELAFESWTLHHFGIAKQMPDGILHILWLRFVRSDELGHAIGKLVSIVERQPTSPVGGSVTGIQLDLLIEISKRFLDHRQFEMNATPQAIEFSALGFQLDRCI